MRMKTNCLIGTAIMFFVIVNFTSPSNADVLGTWLFDDILDPTGETLYGELPQAHNGYLGVSPSSTTRDPDRSTDTPYSYSGNQSLSMNPYISQEKGTIPDDVSLRPSIDNGFTVYISVKSSYSPDYLGFISGGSATSGNSGNFFIGSTYVGGNYYIRGSVLGVGVVDNLLNYSVGTLLNSWTQLAISYDPGDAGAGDETLRLFVNGSLATSVTGTAMDSVEGDISVGYATFGSMPRYYEGYIDEVRITDETLTSGYTPVTFGPSNVPEPTTMLLLGSGVLTIVITRRRRLD